jgi:hypothetical protein
VGKSALGQRLLLQGVPWLTTDVLRTVLRQVLARVDVADTDPVELDDLAEAMYPHLERMADAAVDQYGTVLIEGFEWLPRHVDRLREGVRSPVRAVFIGHRTFSAGDLLNYAGSHRWHERVSPERLLALPPWIRQASDHLAAECEETGERYLDLGELGFAALMDAATASLRSEAPRM